MLQCTQHTVVVDRGGDIVGRPFGRVDGVAQRHADTRMVETVYARAREEGIQKRRSDLNAIERLRSMP